MIEYIFNNFYCWFPNGYYRKRIERNTDFATDSNRKLIEDLDAILETIGFNISRFNNLRQRQHEIIWEVQDLTAVLRDGKEMTHEQEKKVQVLGTKHEII